MSRARAVEFSARTKHQAWARSQGRCENKACGLPLQVGKFQYDHILPAALGGIAALANCQVICDACHKAKTHREDRPRIQKANGQQRAHIGATGPKQKIKSAGFKPTAKQARASKPIDKLAGLPPPKLLRMKEEL